MDARRHGAATILLTTVLTVGLTLGAMPSSTGASAPGAPGAEDAASLPQADPSETPAAQPTAEVAAATTAAAKKPAAQQQAQQQARPKPAQQQKKAAQQKAAQKKAAQKKKARYAPKSGVVFNSALGGPKAKYRIHDHILEAIRKARRGSTVRLMTWNMMSRDAVTVMLNAQKRGVRIRLLMDSTNWSSEVPNPQFKRLRTGLAQGNKGRVKKRRSIAKVCVGSCRGAGGQAHAKFFMFSHTGKARWVLMQGSANLTRAAATNQWNDIQTFVGRKALFNFSVRVFNQMWRDRPVRKPFVSRTFGKDTLFFSPLRGPNYKFDPVMRVLNQVKCRGARGAAGNARGRTIVRVAPDVMRHQRGMRAAKRLKQLWDQGCDVRIGYTVLGIDINRVLRGSGGRGPVPMRHLVQDNNGDGVFDKYFHLKAITINGVYRNNRRAYVLINGSANLSGSAAASDENSALMVGRKALTLRYQKHIDYWFNNPPRSAPLNLSKVMARGFALDPYAKMDMD